MKRVVLDSNQKILAKEIANNLNFSRAISEILAQRGFKNINEVKEFLDFNESNIPSYRLLPDIDRALKRIGLAIFMGEEITVYSDYDADGVTSGAITVNSLRSFGLKVNFFTNDRFKEGFGMKSSGVERLLKQYPNTTLIITTDNGVVAHEAVETAKEKGVDVIITDHHEPAADGSLPDAIAVIDCKRQDNKYPFTEMCGAGIAYRLMEACFDEFNGDKDILLKQLPLVALGTVADCVPLIQENRWYVKEGLRLVGKNKIFNELAYQLKITKFDEETLGFYIGPICNAQSRLKGNAILPISLFTHNEEDRDYIKQTVEELIATNIKRKSVTEDSLVVAKEIIEKNNLSSKNVILLKDDSFLEGIVGIIAGRVVEEYGKPVIVFANCEDGNLKGSARSVEGFNIKETLDKIADDLVAYGGHAMAAGVTIEESKFNEVFDKLDKLASQANLSTTITEDIVNAQIKPDEINMRLIDELEEIRPFGEGNPSVLFEITDFEVTGKRLMKDIHLKLINPSLSALMFNTGADLDKMINEGDVISIIGVPKVNVFNGVANYDVIINGMNRVIK